VIYQQEKPNLWILEWNDHINLYVPYNILVQYKPETDDQGIINNKLQNGLVGIIALIARLILQNY